MAETIDKPSDAIHGWLTGRRRRSVDWPTISLRPWQHADPPRHPSPLSSASDPGRVEQGVPRMRSSRISMSNGTASHFSDTRILAKGRSISDLSWQLVLPGSIRLYGQPHFGGTGMGPR